MGLTQDQWYQKLRGFVPSRCFESEKYNVAVFNAIAAVFARLQVDTDDQVNSTYITGATSPTLDMLGDERSIKRLPGEPDISYRKRVQIITSHTDIVSIKNAVDSFLHFGACTIKEAPFDSAYCHRGTYCARDSYISEYKRDYFLIIVPKQIHAPYSFCHREVYAHRENYVGSLDISGSLFSSIIAAVNAQKAFGVLYRIVVSNH